MSWSCDGLYVKADIVEVDVEVEVAEVKVNGGTTGGQRGDNGGTAGGQLGRTKKSRATSTDLLNTVRTPNGQVVGNYAGEGSRRPISGPWENKHAAKLIIMSFMSIF